MENASPGRSAKSSAAGVLVLVLGLAVAAFFGAQSLRSPKTAPQPKNSTPSGTGATATAAAAACGAPATGTPAKAPLRGLLTVGAAPTGASTEAALAGWSLNVPWSALQTSPGGPIVHPNAIDQAITQAKALGKGDPCAVGIKLRVLAGVNSPGWAKQLTGAPVSLTLVHEGRSGTVPRFWTPQFGAAYADLQAKLAADYDGTPQIRETVMSRCSTFYAEPFLRQLGDPGNLQAFEAAGWSPQADRQCLLDQVNAQKVWTATPSSLALNPYLLPRQAGGTAKADKLALANEVARDCRAVLAKRCILANNSIRWPLLPGYEQLYKDMQALGAPLEFQAAAPKRVGDVVATLKWAIGIGAASVEIAPETAESSPPGLAAAISAWPGAARN